MDAVRQPSDATIEALSDYRPKQPVLDMDIIRAEVITSGLDQLATDMGKVHNLAVTLLDSLRTTNKSGQRVDGEILKNKDPLSTLKTIIRGLAEKAAASTPRAAETLPEGVVRGITTGRVSGGWLIKRADGSNGKNFTLPDAAVSGRLQAGAEILVALTDEVNEHGRTVVRLAQAQ